jgi:predicted nucleic acid-binding protein
VTAFFDTNILIDTLWSEDLQHGHVISGLTIRNPFSG